MPLKTRNSQIDAHTVRVGGEVESAGAIGNLPSTAKIIKFFIYPQFIIFIFQASDKRLTIFRFFH